MIKITHFGSAAWEGALRTGGGSISTESHALEEHPFKLVSRYGSDPGTNPEELLGAAHAGCFTMSFVRGLGASGFEPTHISSRSEVTLEEQADGYVITHVHLIVKARIPGIDQTRFLDLAEQAKAFCPLSKVIRADLTMEAELIA